MEAGAETVNYSNQLIELTVSSETNSFRNWKLAVGTNSSFEEWGISSLF